MEWNPEEAIVYYRRQGAPADQSALVSLLKEAQTAHGGAVPRQLLPVLAEGLGTKEALLLALIRRIPSLTLSGEHLLEICAGPNCGKAKELARYSETLRSRGITVKFVPCMRLCGKGPNIRFNGKLYHRADQALLDQLTKAGK